MAALVQRLRRATGERRQQLRWLGTAAAALVAGFALAVLVGLGGVGAAQIWAVAPLFVAYAWVPVAAGVAILRYRLYDIDVVLNRAVVGAAVVGFVTVGYVVVVVLLGALLGGQGADRYWPSLVATALVALAFQPLRHGVARLGERAVHGRRAAPYQALGDFSHRLARAVSLDQILPGVAEAAGRSLGAGHVTVRLEVPTAEDLTVDWPGPGVPTRADETVPVRHDGSKLGGITVRMPAGRRLSKDDRTLLDDLASQAGLGMHNAQLALRLRAEVDRTVAQADELAASRRRLLAAQESQRQLLRQAIGTDVLPHLAGLRTVLAQQATDGSLAAAAALISQALEALRDLARGMFPPILARRGLVAALGRYAGRTDGRVRLTVSAQLRTTRFAPHVEAVTYFCMVETVRELAGSARVELDLVDGYLLLVVSAVDGGSRTTISGRGVVDRVLACGGTVTTSGPTSTEAGLRIRMPAPAQVPARAHTATSSSGPNADFDR